MSKQFNNEKIDFIFVVLCYRNADDLIEFVKSANTLKDDFKIVVVNSYYDQFTKEKIQEVALKNNCDFLNVENKGYGAGNNQGINYVRNKYKFDFLVICNPDIVFNSFSKHHIDGLRDYIIAPEIKTLSGKDQNPFINKHNNYIEMIEYLGYKFNFKLVLYLGFGINKLFRILSNSRLKKPMKKKEIYASHGSCIIFGDRAINRLKQPYDEKMFLFCEEFHLAKLTQSLRIKTLIIPELKILHKEDGSVGFLKNEAFKIQAKSFIYYYEKWR